MLRAYKYRIYPNKTQKVLLNKTFGCVRFVWNKNVESFLNRTEFKSSTEYRKEFEFLKEVSAATIQQKEIDFKEFKNQRFSKTRKKKIGNPKFKSRRNRQSFRLPNQKFRIEGNKLKLEKIGLIKIKLDREFIGRTISVTISRDVVGDYYASVLVEEEQKSKPKTNKVVGIDLGIKALLTTSDGLQVKTFPDNQRKIKHIQRRLSRKTKGSNRFRRLKLRLAKLHRKETRRREWLLHNISYHLVDNYDLIVAEDLNVAGMMKNHCLAGSIGNASWSTLIKMIDYKSKFYGKEFVKINRWFPSSKTCNCCGQIKDNLKLSDRIYKCECGNISDRDLNATKNIKAVGVTTANQSVMECKTYLNKTSLRQAIPNDLIKFL